MSDDADSPVGGPAAQNAKSQDATGWQQPVGAEPTKWVPPVAEPHKSARWPWIVSAAAVVLALLLGVGGFVAYDKLHSSGSQPEAVLPADAFAFAKLDMDPSASQKIAALRFLHSVPSLASTFDEKSDPARSIFDLMLKSDSLPDGVSFDRDIKPWMQDRIAVAARPALTKDAEPDVILAVQTSDEGKARSAISRLAPDVGEVGADYRKGYLILAKTQAIADRAAADGAASSLADAATFSADMQSLGERGVSSGWLDYGQFEKAYPTSSDSGIFGGQLGAGKGLVGQVGRLGYALRFEAHTLDLVVQSHGGTSGGTPAAPPATASATLADLPDSTAVGVQIAGPDRLVQRGWDAVTSLAGTKDDVNAMVQRVRQQFGISLPGDLTTLVGDQLLVSLDGKGLDSGEPRVAVRAHTDPAAADQVLTRLQAAFRASGQELPLSWKTAKDGVVAATDPAYLASLEQPTGKRLGDDAAFKSALPDTAGASVSAYVNLSALAEVARSSGASAADLRTLDAFRSIGLTASAAGDVGTLRVRLVAH